jgi:hypothetical protein
LASCLPLDLPGRIKVNLHRVNAALATSETGLDLHFNIYDFKDRT